MNIKNKMKSIWPIQAQELFRMSDAEGGIAVYEYKKFRTLVFDDSHLEQSKVRIGDPLYLDHEYLQAMLLPILQINPAHVALLGLGAGSLASCLYYIFYDARVTAIEWRGSVIDIAYRFFDLPKDDRLKVVEQDAMDWLQQAPDQSIDLILSDLYHADKMHEIQKQRQFFEQAQRVLTHKGWIAINYCEFPAANSPIILNICRSFPSIFMLHLNSGNWVLLATSQEISLPAMMAMPPNKSIPNGVLNTLKLLQGRLLKVSASREKKT